MLDGVLTRLFFAALLIGFGGIVSADSCSDCKTNCNTSEQAQACVSVAEENGGYATCGALIAACAARCECPDPKRVHTCVFDAYKRHNEREGTCFRQFPTNPTGCLDQINRTYKDELASCKNNP